MTALQAIKRTGYIAIIGFPSVVTNAGVLFLLVGAFGILGAALGRGAMMVVMFVATYLAARNFLKVPWDKLPIRKGILASLIVATPLFLLDSLLKSVGLALLEVAILDVVLFFVTTLTCLRLLKLFDQEDIELLKSVLPRPFKGLTSIMA